MAIILENPMESYNSLKQEFDQYAEVSGMKINLNKTEMLVKNLSLDQEKELKHISGIQIAKKVKYLGVNFSTRISSLYKENYEKILGEIEQDLKKWENLQSLLGRNATIKMSILPRLVFFFFQTIPISLNKNFFTKLNQKISKFIWMPKNVGNS